MGGVSVDTFEFLYGTVRKAIRDTSLWVSMLDVTLCSYIAQFGSSAEKRFYCDAIYFVTIKGIKSSPCILLCKQKWYYHNNKWNIIDKYYPFLVSFGCAWQRNGRWCELDVVGKVSGRYRYIFCLDITITHARKTDS